MKKKVIVAGHICLDITPVFSEKKRKDLSELLQPGKLIHMEAAHVSTGGAVANTGLTMKLLGADVSLIGKVGRDSFGEMICRILGEYGVENGMLISEKESTSYSVILAAPGIDRIFLHHPGANDSFRSDDISDQTLKEAALMHFGYPPSMKSMYENGGNELVKLLKRARNLNVATSLDLASVDAESEAGKVDWKSLLKRTIPYVDFFVPSVEELCYMLDRERYVKWQRLAAGRDITELLTIEQDVRPLAEQCMELGAKVILIKCGSLGIYYKTADKKDLYKVGSRLELDVESWAKKEGLEKSYIPEKILSATGAGDTSIAAFLTAMLKGYSLERCLQLATAAGASCLTSYDALGGLIPLEELIYKIDAGWLKQENV